MHNLAFLLDSQPDTAQVMQMLTAMAAGFFVFFLILIALVMVPCWFICKKAGFSPWLALLCLLPSLGTLVLLYVLAFAEWKVVPAPLMGLAQPPYPPYPPR